MFLSGLVSAVCILMLTVPVSIATAESAAQNNYTVTNGNITCVVMTSTMELTIPYIGNAQNKTASITISHNSTTYSGLCNNTQGRNTLSIRYNDLWRLTVVFRSSGVNHSLFHWGQIDLDYVLNPIYFPDVANASAGSQKFMTTLLDNSTFESSVGGSYSCQSESTLLLNGDIDLHVYSLQYRAFGDSNRTWFSEKDVTSCPEFVPDVDVGFAVAVGIALVAMIAVVVILYLIISNVTRIWRNKLV